MFVLFQSVPKKKLWVFFIIFYFLKLIVSDTLQRCGAYGDCIRSRDGQVDAICAPQLPRPVLPIIAAMLAARSARPHVLRGHCVSLPKRKELAVHRNAAGVSDRPSGALESRDSGANAVFGFLFVTRNMSSGRQSQTCLKECFFFFLFSRFCYCCCSYVACVGRYP